MNKKYVLKPWVKATLMLLPEIVIVIELFFVAQKLNQVIENTNTPSVIVETRCDHEQ